MAGKSEAGGYIFLCFAEKDHDYAVRLANVLRASGLTVWYDEDIVSGERWDRVLRERIESCGAMVVVMSTAAEVSTWVDREVALAERVRRPIFPLLLEGRPFFRLQDLQYEDVRGGRMPSRAFVSRLQGHFGIGTTRIDEVPTPRLHPEEHTAMVTLVQQAFDAAGRRVSPTLEPELLLPGPVFVSDAASPTARDIDRYRQLHGQRSSDQPGFFVHSGELQSDALAAVDRLRLAGNPVITVSVRAVRAALADGSVASFLNELERTSAPRLNLFDTRNALVDERFLFGREWMLSTIGSAIKRDEHVLITGLRKVGKTSLLNILRQHLVDNPVCMVDLQRYDRNHEEWPPLLFHAMVEAFDRWGMTGLAGAAKSAWPFAPEEPNGATALAKELSARIEHVRRITGTTARLIVILDELERILPLPGEEDAARRWVRATGALRSLGQGADRSTIVIAADLRPAANRTNDLGQAGTNPWFSLFHEMPLRLLDREPAADMVESVGRLMGITTVTNDFHTRMFGLTGGHPSLARMIAGAAYTRRAAPHMMDVADLETGLESLEDSQQIETLLRSNLWQLMEPAERAAARLLAGPDRPTAGEEPRGLREAFSMLRSQGLIGRDGHSIGLFADWIAQLDEDDR